MKPHKMQSPDKPTWCVNCGRFDIYATEPDCNGDDRELFDSQNPENMKRMMSEIFGTTEDKTP